MNLLKHTQCASCNKINCNGLVHRNVAEFIYPVCQICGIELLDLIELLENSQIRNKQTCELCPHTYTSKIDFDGHFPSHFYKSSPRHEPTFYCITCSDQYNLENSVKLKWPHTNAALEKLDNPTKKQLKIIGSTAKGNQTSSRKLEILINGNTQQTDELPIEYSKNMFSDVSRLHCKTCNKGFGTDLELEFHQSNYHSNRKAKLKEDDIPETLHGCPLCEEVFYTRNKRVAHIREKHMDKETNTIPCPYCDKSFLITRYIVLFLT